MQDTSNRHAANVKFRYLLDRMSLYEELRTAWHSGGCRGKGVKVHEAWERARDALADSNAAEGLLTGFEKGKP